VTWGAGSRLQLRRPRWARGSRWSSKRPVAAMFENTAGGADGTFGLVPVRLAGRCLDRFTTSARRRPGGHGPASSGRAAARKDGAGRGRTRDIRCRATADRCGARRPVLADGAERLVEVAEDSGVRLIVHSLAPVAVTRAGRPWRLSTGDPRPGASPLSACARTPSRSPCRRRSRPGLRCAPCPRGHVEARSPFNSSFFRSVRPPDFRSNLCCVRRQAARRTPGLTGSPLGSRGHRDRRMRGTG